PAGPAPTTATSQRRSAAAVNDNVGGTVTDVSRKAGNGTASAAQPWPRSALRAPPVAGPPPRETPPRPSPARPREPPATTTATASPLGPPASPACTAGGR